MALESVDKVETASKEDLFKGILAQDFVDLDGIGRVIVRALTRHEIQMLKADDPKANGESVEVRMVVAGLVEPTLDANEAKELVATMDAKNWKKLTRAIGKLSGLEAEDGNQKS